MSEANKLFYEEVREKKTTASGVHGKKGKKGQVGKMITPADLSGSEYRQARDLPTFNVYDFLHKLQEAPTLKSVLLARLDEEYRNYRLATEKTLDAVAEIVKMGLDPIYAEVAALRRQLDDVCARIETVDREGDWPRVKMGREAGSTTGEETGRERGRRRIRWGATPEAIRETVFAQLRALVDEGEEISTETIKQRIPSMLRWIYGEKAVFAGIDGLRREFLQATGRPPASAAPAETPAEAQQQEAEEPA